MLKLQHNILAYNLLNQNILSILKTEFAMKKTSIAALLILSLYAPLSAHAADFSGNGFSCDLTDIELKPWWVPFVWGQWTRFNVKIYKTQSPEKAVTYVCTDISLGNTTFGCTLEPVNQVLVASMMNLAWAMNMTNFRPGITKGQACEIALNAARK
jgi:hypothetical protein